MAPLVAAGAMAGLGSWGLSRGGSLTNDETATFWAARLGLHQLRHLVGHIDAVHAVYYLLIHGWLAVGSSPAALRTPSLVAMVLGVALVAELGRRLTGSVVAGAAAGLVAALTPSISVYAQTARSYALVYACVAALSLVLVRAVTRPRGAAPWWLLYAVLAAVAGWLNELSLLVLAAHAVTMLLLRCRWRLRLGWLAAACAGGLLVTPLIRVSAGESGAVAYLTAPGWNAVVTLFHLYAGDGVAAAAIVAVAALAGVVPGPAGLRRPLPTLPALAVPLLIVPAALLMAEANLATPFYDDRYVLYGEQGVALLAGAGLARLGVLARRAGARLGPRLGTRLVPHAVPAAALVAVLLAQLSWQSYDRTPDSQQSSYWHAAQVIGSQARRGDGVLFLDSFYRKVWMGFPRQFRDTTDFAMLQSPAVTGDFRGSNRPGAQLPRLMLGYHRIWSIGEAPWDYLHPGPMFGARTVLFNHFRIVEQAEFESVFVTLWVQN